MRKMQKGNKYTNRITGKEVRVKSINEKAVTFDNGDIIPAEAIQYCFFYNKGEKIETGTLEIEKVLAGIPDGIILQVASLGGGKKDLFAYDAVNDRFEKLIQAADSYRIAFTGRTWGVIGTFSRPGDKNKKEEMLFVYDGKTRINTHWDPAYRVCDDDFVPIDNREGNAGSVVLFSATPMVEKEDENGNVFSVPGEKEKGGIVRNILIGEEKGADGNINYNAQVLNTKIKGNVMRAYPVQDGKGSLLVLGSEYNTINPWHVIYTNQGGSPIIATGDMAVKTAVLYPHMIKLETPNPGKNILWLLDDWYNIAKINVEKTKDRGYVTTVEELRRPSRAVTVREILDRADANATLENTKPESGKEVSKDNSRNKGERTLSGNPSPSETVQDKLDRAATNASIQNAEPGSNKDMSKDNNRNGGERHLADRPSPAETVQEKLDRATANAALQNAKSESDKDMLKDNNKDIGEQSLSGRPSSSETVLEKLNRAITHTFFGKAKSQSGKEASKDNPTNDDNPTGADR